MGVVRILLINQFFWPDLAPTSQLLTDVARGLEERGHDVHVICADGRYAGLSDSPQPPVTIHRMRSLPFVRGVFGRLLSYASFYLSAALAGLTTPRADVVLTLTTPPLLPMIGTLIKRLRGSKHFIWEMDVYPDVAVALNYFKAGGWLDRLTGLIADYSRSQADGILALGPCMRDRLLGRGIRDATIMVTENWADGETIQPLAFIPNRGALHLLYSGNLGLAHDIDTILDAMRQLRDRSRFYFMFAGNGQLKASLEAACTREQIASASFRSYSPKESFSESLGWSDIGLVTQRTSCLGLVVPSKVYGLLAAGRPILFVGPAEATVSHIIRRFQCGWQVECGDSKSLVDLLQFLANDRNQVETAGHRARQAFLNHYDLPFGVSRICTLIAGAGTSDPTECDLFPSMSSSSKEL